MKPNEEQDPDLQKLLPGGYNDTTTICCSSWLVSMLLDFTDSERNEALTAWLHYTQGDFDYLPQSSAAKALARQMRPSIKASIEKYKRVVEGGRNGGNKSSEKRNNQKSKNQDVAQPPYNPPQAGCNPLNKNKNKNTNNPPSNTPANCGGVSGGMGGVGFSFFDFFTYAKKVYRTNLRDGFGNWVQFEGAETALERALICSFQNDDLKNEIWRKAVEIKEDSTTINAGKARVLVEYLEGVKSRFAQLPDGALALVYKLVKAKIQQTRKEVFAKYIDSHRDQWQPAQDRPGIFEGIQNRVTYIESLEGQTINSISGILDKWPDHIGD